jgi:hypothetical protein
MSPNDKIQKSFRILDSKMNPWLGLSRQELHSTVTILYPLIISDKFVRMDFDAFEIQRNMSIFLAIRNYLKTLNRQIRSLHESRG